MQILHNTLSRYKPTTLYNLDVIISVGYRVKSKRGTMFRQWANKILKEYLLQGYAVNKRMELIADAGISIPDLQSPTRSLSSLLLPRPNFNPLYNIIRCSRPFG